MATTKKDSGSFTEDERAAMKARAAEARAEKKGAKKEAERQMLLDALAELEGDDKALAEQLHAVITAAAPDLDWRTYYGMPAYARDGKVVVFFQPAGKFKSRFSTLGFTDSANLDDGGMWPTSWAITELTAADEKRIAELVTAALA
ncbi:iron chaperone [Homoserinibacter sp. GY 40078]|uniref:iron chaperone n=1 Tax=Homoserinibacter sp. GY 40078 TaxID=2603275 RepID=UPI0011C9CF6C|nr:DUF1801 domain-containing protein [Homoserinibacter sp. GY 40078]TXK16430.1 DUF1801 domain-containing protein [Homoserinibacter sp. GY 40078]